MNMQGRRIARFGTMALTVGILVHTCAGGMARAGSVQDERAQPFVCAQVVLAIDASGSTRAGTFHRQVNALTTAFRSQRLLHAIQDCLPGSVAVTITTWSGAAEHDLCLDWSMISGEEDAQRIATRLGGCRYFGGTTDIGMALGDGLRRLESAPFLSFYRAVLLLTNGRTNRGAEATLQAARAAAAAGGVTIAAHALLHPDPGGANPFYVADAIPLDRYAADHIVAGPRAFTAHSRPGTDDIGVLQALVELLRQESS